MRRCVRVRGGLIVAKKFFNAGHIGAYQVYFCLGRRSLLKLRANYLLSLMVHLG